MDPDGWPRHPRRSRLVLGVVLFGPIAAGCAALTVLAVIEAEAAVAGAALYGALLFGHLTGLGVSRLRRPRPDGSGPTRTTFAYARGPYYWLLTVTVLVALATAGLASIGASAGGVGGWLLALVTGGATGYLLWFVVAVLRTGRGRLTLTAAGVHHRGLTFEHFVPWYAVVDVVTDQEQEPVIAVKAYPAEDHRYVQRLRAYETGFLPFLLVQAYWLGAAAVPAHRALRFWFDHPDRRGELPAP